MAFLALFLRGISVLPSVIQGIESIFGAKTGESKKAAALDIVSSAIKVVDAIANKTIIDPAGFTAGLSTIIDGVVACLNASIWEKSTAATATTASAS